MRAVVLVFLAFLALSVTSHGNAQESGITIQSTSAEASYPAGVTFWIGASAEAPIVKAELFYARANEETLLLESTPIEPALQIDHEIEVDLLNNFLPPGIEITYVWRVTDELGNTADSAPQTIDWIDQRFEWTKLAGDGIEVFTYSSSESFAASILETAQSTVAKLKNDYGVTGGNPIRLWVYENREEFSGAQVPNSGEWVVGSAFPEWGLILAVLPDGDTNEMVRVVPHEITHQVLHQATENPFNAPPLWFDEGFAVLQQETGNSHFPGIVEDAAREGRLLSLRSLTGEYPYDSSEVTLAYAESYDVLVFIIDQWGIEGIGRIVSAYQQGVTHDDAFVAALGVTIDELDQLWQESINVTDSGGFLAGLLGENDDSAIGQLVIQSSAVILILAAIISFTVMSRRARRNAFAYDDFGSEVQGS